MPTASARAYAPREHRSQEDGGLRRQRQPDLLHHAPGQRRNSFLHAGRVARWPGCPLSVARRTRKTMRHRRVGHGRDQARIPPRPTAPGSSKASSRRARPAPVRDSAATGSGSQPAGRAMRSRYGRDSCTGRPRQRLAGSCRTTSSSDAESTSSRRVRRRYCPTARRARAEERQFLPVL